MIIGETRPQVVPTTRSSIRAAMRNQRLTYPYSGYLPYWLSPTMGRLKGLALKSPEKYKAYAELVKFFIEMAQRQKVNLELELYAPSETALLAIDIGFLVESLEDSGDERIRKEIVSRCYFPTQRMIDLRPLEVINRKYTRPAAS